MCLSEKGITTDKLPKWIDGWKIFLQDEEGNLFGYSKYTTKYQYAFDENGVVEDTNEKSIPITYWVQNALGVHEKQSMEYQSGFHVFINKEKAEVQWDEIQDALSWMGFAAKDKYALHGKQFVLRRVRLMNIVVKGKDADTGIKTYVGRKLKLLEATEH